MIFYTDNFLNFILIVHKFDPNLCYFYFLAYKGIDKRNLTTRIGGEALGTVSLIALPESV